MNFPLEELKSYMQSIGDSVVTFQTGTVVKLHVHTMTPYKVLEYCQKFGEFLTVKIENMTLQHNGLERDDPVKKELIDRKHKANLFKLKPMPVFDYSPII